MTSAFGWAFLIDKLPIKSVLGINLTFQAVICGTLQFVATSKQLYMVWILIQVF
jgi:hypothetical protein